MPSWQVSCVPSVEFSDSSSGTSSSFRSLKFLQPLQVSLSSSSALKREQFPTSKAAGLSTNTFFGNAREDCGPRVSSHCLSAGPIFPALNPDNLGILFEKFKFSSRIEGFKSFWDLAEMRKRVMRKYLEKAIKNLFIFLAKRMMQFFIKKD
mmetsp:Transcript_45643/g.121335  ORF Transcript_45643/g.121335 Transcript_45643/m.121335 type:complete len:151 (+) Transcript_45643:265-717(+)